MGCRASQTKNHRRPVRRSLLAVSLSNGAKPEGGGYVPAIAFGGNGPCVPEGVFDGNGPCVRASAARIWTAIPARRDGRRRGAQRGFRVVGCAARNGPYGADCVPYASLVCRTGRGLCW